MTVEEWRIEKVRMEGQIELLSQKVDTLQKSIEGIQGTVGKVVWLIVSGFGAALVAWVVNGGLAIG